MIDIKLLYKSLFVSDFSDIVAFLLSDYKPARWGVLAHGLVGYQIRVGHTVAADIVLRCTRYINCNYLKFTWSRRKRKEQLPSNI